MNSAALLPCLIVAQERPDLLARFAERLSTVMPVVLDRRREVRRRRTAPIAIERRRTERRQLLTHPTRERFASRGYQLVYAPRVDADGLGDLGTPAFCGECERILDVEMPLFVATPARVDLDVRHIQARGRVDHRVAIEAFLDSGRRLLTCQINAREV
jgi:hypothetical protein